ncbi:probable G-protein coupled receptor No9 [Lingula anatina]|uniref:Probable G-protein coupled receptor No9 n=1 Tax=Lingula anatina TaxID=7574 RepID=A0A1S3HWU2_LINAN|nr:probable G-protein coupled receptor No9 [Lingula anatina]|eukprot:XP_013389529.1 probable G-protein coupled receptor No9 [Lingula anatina]
MEIDSSFSNGSNFNFSTAIGANMNVSLLGASGEFGNNLTSEGSGVVDGTPVNLYKIITAAAQGILMILICFGNGMVIGAFYRSEKLKTITNYYIMHLACADFAVGLFLPFQMTCFLHPEILENIFVCLFRYATMVVTQSASILCLLAITIDRYSAVIYHMRYYSVMSRRRSIFTIFIVWLTPLVCGLMLPFLWYNGWPAEGEKDCDFGKTLTLGYNRYVTVGAFLTVTLVIIGLYSRIFHVARRHNAQINDTATLQPNHSSRTFSRNFRIAKTAAIVIGLYLIFWSPFFIILAIQVYGGLVNSQLLIELRVYASVLAVLNSAVNPVVYAYRMCDFKREFRRMLGLKYTTDDSNDNCSVGNESNQTTGTAATAAANVAETF